MFQSFCEIWRFAYSASAVQSYKKMKHYSIGHSLASKTRRHMSTTTHVITHLRVDGERAADEYWYLDKVPGYFTVFTIQLRKRLCKALERDLVLPRLRSKIADSETLS